MCLVLLHGVPDIQTRVVDADPEGVDSVQIVQHVHVWDLKFLRT